MLRLTFAWLAAAAFAASLGYCLYAYVYLFDGTSGSAGAMLTNLGVFTAFALHHSVFARTGVKNMVKAVISPAMERAVYTMVASILFAGVCWLWQPVEGLAWSLPGAWRWVGLAAQVTGIVMTIVAARALDVLDLAGVRQVMRTSSPHMPLETDGVYGFVRHPLYFAWMLLVFGAPRMTMTRLTFAVISTLYLAIAIPFEERSLIETFGPDYASYQKKVRWRMLPGIY